jgi:hypothetical protein
VLDNTDGPSSLATSISTTGELLKGRINATAANGVCWGSHSVMVAAVLHFAALRSELELLGSGRTTDPGAHGLRLDGVVCSFLDCSLPS